MSDRIKRILMILGFLFLTIILGYLLYYLFLRQAPVPEQPLVNGINQPVNGLPTAGTNVNRPTYVNINGKLVPAGNVNTTPPPTASTVARGGETEVKTLTDQSTLGSTLAANGRDLIYYNKNDGKFYNIDSQGNSTSLSDKIFHNVQTITWAPDKEKAVLTYPDGSNIIYNFQTQKQYSLPTQWKDFSFSPDSSQLAAKNWTVDELDRYLIVAKDDGSSYRNVETLGRQDANVHVDWSPNRQIVATFNEGINLESQYLYFIGQNHEQFNVPIIEGRDFRQLWSPTGEKLLYSVYHTATNLNPSLWVIDASGDNIGQGRTPLDLQTWADKCAFADAATIYCAVPKRLEAGSGLVPDYAANVPDNFYKIDLKNYSKSLIAVPATDFTASNLSVSQDGKYLYFTDANTGTLQEMQLK